MRKIILFFILVVLVALSWKSISYLRGPMGQEQLLLLKHKYFCVTEGEIGRYYNKDKCCAGLEAVVPLSFVEKGTAPDFQDKCFISGAGGSFKCTKCGNGICEKVENSCNCSKDCSK